MLRSRVAAGNSGSNRVTSRCRVASFGDPSRVKTSEYARSRSSLSPVLDRRPRDAIERREHAFLQRAVGRRTGCGSMDVSFPLTRASATIAAIARREFVSVSARSRHCAGSCHSSAVRAAKSDRAIRIGQVRPDGRHGSRVLAAVKALRASDAARGSRGTVASDVLAVVGSFPTYVRR